MLLDPTLYSNSYFGSGYGPVVWSNVDCNGWETNVFECNKNVYPDTSCPLTNIVGLSCRDSTELRPLKLTYCDVSCQVVLMVMFGWWVELLITREQLRCASITCGASLGTWAGTSKMLKLFAKIWDTPQEVS